MGKGSKSGAASHQIFKDRENNRVDDLQGMFSDLQSARKESRTVDANLLEEQVHQMLREWKAELNEPASPASSLQQDGSLGSFSSDIYRLLQLCEEEDDATSTLAAPKLEPEPDMQKIGFEVPEGIQEQSAQLVNQSRNSGMGVDHIGMNHMNLTPQLDYHSFDFHPELEQQCFPSFSGTCFIGEDGIPQIPDYQQNISPPPSAFLGPKCSLWDCSRPALASDWSEKSDDYCSTYHARLAPAEGYLGRPPVVRPGGIGLKDNLLFAALSSRAEGKDVGIPECEGAATAKSPWNAPGKSCFLLVSPAWFINIMVEFTCDHDSVNLRLMICLLCKVELFDVIVLDGETMREWLFFDKPRRAFESGSRKQRSLPDYSGRGWHESRKQVMNEFNGLKRSYYMDPQPMGNFEWHLYEYEINKYDACALYRLELKRADGKKISKGKLGNDSVADLQKQMGRLTAEFPNEKQRTVKGRGKSKDETRSIYSTSDQSANLIEGPDYSRGAANDYLVDSMKGHHLT